MGATEAYNWDDWGYNPSGITYQNGFFSNQIFRDIPLPSGVVASTDSQQKAYMDAWIREQGGLGTWTAGTGPITLSGGGDPRYHGQYDYIGYYAGKPVYRRGNVVIAFVDAWQVWDYERGPVYNGSGAAAYPSQVDHWTAMQGQVNNVPTFTRGWGGTAEIPLWPVLTRVPGIAPIDPSWTQQPYVYQPSDVAIVPAANAPVGSRDVLDLTGGFYGASNDMTTVEYLGPPVEDDDDGNGVMAIAPEPVPTLYCLQSDGSLGPCPPETPSSSNPLSNIVAADGTIFGFSPLVLAGVVIGAFFLLSGGKK